MAEAPQKREPETKRRIPVSGEGRLRYQPGDPHALDVQFDESRLIGQQLTSAAEALTPLLDALEEYQQLPARLATDDDDLAAFLGEHYRNRKHVDHMVNDIQHEQVLPTDVSTCPPM